MPLKQGKSRATFKKNVSELMDAFKRKGKIGTSTPKNAAKARQQALAIAFSMKRKSRGK